MIKDSVEPDFSDKLDLQICRKLRELRVSKGITQKQLAKIIGVSYQQAQKYETGQNRLSAGRLALVAVGLSVPVSYFFSAENEADEQSQTKDHVTRSDVEAARYFSKIRSKTVKKALIVILRAVAERH